MRYPVNILIVVTALALTGCMFTDGDDANQTEEVELGPSEPTVPEPTTPAPAEPEPTEPSDPVMQNVSLYWSAPVDRVNGDPLSHDEIGGYRIRYSRVSEVSYTIVELNDPTAIQYHIEDLEAGEYQFEVAVFDTGGLYSDYSIATE